MTGMEMKRWHARPWFEVLATVALIAICLWPYFADVDFWPACGILLSLFFFASINGCPRMQFLRYTWIALFWILICITLPSFVLTMAETPPESLRRGLYIEQSGPLNAAVAFIIYVGFSSSKHYEVEAAKKRRLAEYQATYRTLLTGDETSLRGLDTTSLGYPPNGTDKCYVAGDGVSFGYLEEWNKEASTEISAQLKAAVAGVTFKVGEKTQHVMQTFVEQHPGVLLIFESRVLFFNLQTKLAIPVADIELVLWMGWHLILVVKDRENPLVFRVPETVPSWIYAAAVLRAKNNARDLSDIRLEDG